MSSKTLPNPAPTGLQTSEGDAPLTASHQASVSYQAHLPQNKHQQIVTATVLAITKEHVNFDLGLKSDGTVARTEFRDMPDLQVGDTVELYVEAQEDKRGNLCVSRKQAKAIRSWERIQEAYGNQTSVECVIKKRTPGGLLGDADGIEVFLPGGQVMLTGTPEDFDAYVNKIMEVMVINITPAKVNVVVSHRALLRKALESQRKALVQNLEVGQVLEGEVRNITNFGVFIELGGITGLAYFKDLSWDKRIDHPEKVLDEEGNPMFFKGKKIKVAVIDFDIEKGHVSLATKPLLPNPWETLSEEIKEGSKLTGKVTKIIEHGAFVEIAKHIEGFLHISELSYSSFLKSPEDVLQEGQEITCMVLRISRKEQDIRLGLKQLQEDPWQQEDFLVKYALDSKHDATVRQFVEAGTYIELEPGVVGFLHNSHLSWIKRIPHVRDLFEKGSQQKVVVLSVDQEERKIELGFRELEDSPWTSFETTFTVGSQHQGTLLRKVSRGAIVELPYGIEVFVQQKGLEKQDKTPIKEGDVLPFAVLDFIKYEHRIVVSHTATHKAVKASTYKSNKPHHGAPVKFVSSAKTTLGEMGSLTKLKEELKEQQK